MAGETILIVDDAQQNHHFLNDYVLVPNGYKPQSARDGVEGLQMALRLRPDLILLDLNMPRMDGMEVLRQLNANNVDIPVGVAQSRMPDSTLVSDYTQWIVVKDLTNNVLKIADYTNRMNYLTIDMKAVFGDGKPMAKLVNDLPYPKSVAGADALRPETNAAASR